jgi:hypothetical protein
VKINYNILILRALKSILRNQEVVINLRAKMTRKKKKRRNKKVREAKAVAEAVIEAAAQIPKGEEVKGKIKINEAAFKRVATSIENYKITCGVSKIVALA